MTQLATDEDPRTTAVAGPPAHPRRTRPGWARILAGGLALWSATVVVTFATRNANLIPTVILLGSFLIPATFVSYAFARADEIVTAQRILTAFVYGGVLGVLGASVLEVAFLRQPSWPDYLGVGLIEETVKLSALWLITRRLPRYTVRDGMVLGAAVGFGFAAFESAGYAFNALFTSSGLSLLNLVETEALRGILSPFGHGLWTAILGGALFATATRTGRLRPRWALLGWLALVAVLHALWDAAGGIAQWLTLLLTGTPAQLLAIQQGGSPPVTQTQVHLFTGLDWALLALDGIIGLLLVIGRWRRAAVPRPHSASHPATPNQPFPDSLGGVSG